ncbi:MAG TPA: hypothetical protein VKA49_04800 [Flavitalea sp.]|nr:hypothetical protein [Flavitalea sp.]
MKNQIIRRFGGFIASFLVLTSSFSQVSEFKDLKPAVVIRDVKVYQNILDEFHKQFPAAENISWSRLGKNFLSNFNSADKKYAVLFKPEASVVYKITYGTEKHLPVDIRKWVKRVYVEFNIASAIEIKEAGRNIWLINVVDNTEFAWVKVENDEIVEVQKYTKYIPNPVPGSNLVKQ